MRLRLAYHRSRQFAFCLAGLFVCLTASFLWSDDAVPSPRRAASPHPEKLHAESSPSDPIALNGPIFVDWPKPQVAILFSGEMDGYLEPCGCAGLENQKGGLKRRHTLIKQLEANGWPVISLDMGGQIRRLGPQAEIKYRYALQSLMKLGYAAIGFGVRELQLSTDAVLYVLANLDPEKNPLVSANVGLFGFDSGLSRRYRIIEAGGRRVGVTAVVGRKHRASLQNATDITWIDPEKAIQEVLPILQSEHCETLVLLVHGDPKEAADLAKRFPQFQFVATTGGAPEPPNRAHAVEGTKARLIEVGHKGMYVVVVGLYKNPQQPPRYQRVPLDHRFDDSDAMQAMLVAYQEELKNTGFAGLGITGVKHATNQFLGTATCADCHTQAAEVFESTPHAQATETLVDLDPPRHFDPECLSCHATGWEPQEYFPYDSGFLGLRKTPHLVGNGCENCHGPGASHVAAETGDQDVDDQELERRRAALRLKIVENEGNKDDQPLGTVVKKCLECHDTDNSPEFDFQAYWPHVEHIGKD